MDKYYPGVTPVQIQDLKLTTTLNCDGVIYNYDNIFDAIQYGVLLREAGQNRGWNEYTHPYLSTDLNKCPTTLIAKSSRYSVARCTMAENRMQTAWCSCTSSGEMAVDGQRRGYAVASRTEVLRIENASSTAHLPCDLGAQWGESRWSVARGEDVKWPHTHRCCDARRLCPLRAYHVISAGSGMS